MGSGMEFCKLTAAPTTRWRTVETPQRFGLTPGTHISEAIVRAPN